MMRFFSLSSSKTLAGAGRICKKELAFIDGVPSTHCSLDTHLSLAAPIFFRTAVGTEKYPLTVDLFLEAALCQSVNLANWLITRLGDRNLGKLK